MAAEDEGQLQPIVEAVANGSTINWSARYDAADDEAKELLGALHAIAGIAGFHRQRALEDSETSLGDVLARAPAAAPVDPRAQPDLSRGEPWGPLIVLEQIDGGSFGDVFKAWDPGLAKVVALKRTRYSSAADAARAVSEAQRLASIPPHPNVITVYGACNINGVVGIWMEFLRGRTLRRVVEDEGELGWVEATHYGECLCRALAHVHGALVLHRDLKAANVMKAAGGRIVLIDFGSGGEIVPLGARTSDRLVGTLPYMAPELFRGQPASQQSDIYSLGVLLFNLVTGSYPVSGNSREDFERAHQTSRPALLSDVRSDLPLDFVRIVERAIAPDPRQRYRTAGEFLSALDWQGRPAVSPAVSADAWATRVLWTILIACGGLTVIGWLTTRVFNQALERPDSFAVEGVVDWLQVGGKASLKPAFIAIVAFLLMQLASGMLRLLCSVSSRARSLDASAGRRLGRLAKRLRLDDPAVLGVGLLLVSMVALVSVWWSFSDLLGTVLTTRISGASIEALNLLAPFMHPYFEWYREVAMYLTVVLVVAWYWTGRHVLRTSGSLKNPFLIAAGVVVSVSILSFSLPYRLIVQPKVAAARWHESDCYVIGESASDFMLFCPALEKRINFCPKGEKLERSELRNIFEMFDSPHTW